MGAGVGVTSDGAVRLHCMQRVLCQGRGRSGLNPGAKVCVQQGGKGGLWFVAALKLRPGLGAGRAGTGQLRDPPSGGKGKTNL